jgi:coenzyme F420-0:L-glutamate ligase / coenzyme F420-1:gamma-L-glutamate ligase
VADLTIRPVTGIGEVRPGDDLAGMIAAAAPWLADGDVLVVTSKAVSKAEGRLVRTPADPEGRERVRQAAIDGETVRVVARRGPTRIVQTRHGFVLAAAGVDASNVRRDEIALLPLDPDASAARLRDRLRELLRVELAVIVSDTMGRPWRNGQTDVAIGAAGIAALDDFKGRTDDYGNALAVTAVAVIDELAAAAELVKGKLAGVPAAVVRGLDYPRDDAGARPLVRPADTDLFRHGAVDAVYAALAGGEPRGVPVPPEVRERAAAAAGCPVHATADPTVLATTPPGGRRLAGAAVARLLVALAAEGYPATASPDGTVTT